MTPESIDALPKYTAAQAVTYLDSLIMGGKAGTSYSVRGRQMTHPSLEILLKLRDYYAQRASQDDVAATDSPLGQVFLAEFRRPC
jgi:hypothetical protein